MPENIQPLFLPIKAAALEVGINYKVLLEAVKSGTVPHHRLGRSRRLVRIEDILNAMERISATEVCHD